MNNHYDKLKFSNIELLIWSIELELTKCLWAIYEPLPFSKKGGQAKASLCSNLFVCFTKSMQTTRRQEDCGLQRGQSSSISTWKHSSWKRMRRLKVVIKASINLLSESLAMLGTLLNAAWNESLACCERYAASAS